MNRSELIQRLTIVLQKNTQLGLNEKDVEIATKLLLRSMTQSISDGQRIEIRGFGSFSLSYQKPRIGRNPKTGESVQIPEKHAPHFKMGKELRDRVNQCISVRW